MCVCVCVCVLYYSVVFVSFFYLEDIYKAQIVLNLDELTKKLLTDNYYTNLK